MTWGTTSSRFSQKKHKLNSDLELQRGLGPPDCPGDGWHEPGDSSARAVGSARGCRPGGDQFLKPNPNPKPEDVCPNLPPALLAASSQWLGEQPARSSPGQREHVPGSCTLCTVAAHSWMRRGCAGSQSHVLAGGMQGRGKVLILGPQHPRDPSAKAAWGGGDVPRELGAP